MLTLRLFVENNESISIGRVATRFELLPLPDELSRPDARTKLNAYLDGPNKLITAGSELGHRHILLNFLHEQIAHASANKKEKFDRWREDDMIFGMIQSRFHIIVIDLLQLLRRSRDHHICKLLFLNPVRCAITSVAAVKGDAVRCVTAQHFVLLRSQLNYWNLCSRTRR
ncbi:MAG: hypothetical protein ABJC26_06855 [Gemmatimonadaceae bacterium]